MDKCFFCKGIIQNNFTNYTADLDEHFIIIKNIPCHKCEQCGEVSFSGETVLRIEEIINELKKNLTKITIIEYTN